MAYYPYSQRVNQGGALSLLALFCVVLLFFASVMSGILQFHLWGQVTRLWEMDESLRYLLFHHHGTRYLVVLPIFICSDLLNVSYNALFSFTVPVLLLISSGLVARAVCLNLHRNTPSYFLFFTVIGFSALALLSIFMNGRLVFSMLGASILVFVLCRWEMLSDLRVFFYTAGALLLTTVSSGTFFVGFSWVVLFLLARFIGRGGRGHKLDVGAHLVFVLAFFGPVFWVFLNKLILYFGLDSDFFIEMLSHGIGGLLAADNLVASAVGVSALAALGFFAVSLGFGGPGRRWPVIMAGLAMAGGVFGLSASVMAIPPLLFLFLIGFHEVVARA